MIVFPISILLLFGELSAIKGVKINFNNGKGEAEIHAPDPGEVSETEEKKVFELLKKLKQELSDNGFNAESFPRGEHIDAIRIYP